MVIKTPTLIIALVFRYEERFNDIALITVTSIAVLLVYEIVKHSDRSLTKLTCYLIQYQ